MRKLFGLYHTARRLLREIANDICELSKPEPSHINLYDSRRK
jgi:hypothetical protein